MMTWNSQTKYYCSTYDSYFRKNYILKCSTHPFESFRTKQIQKFTGGIQSLSTSGGLVVLAGRDEVRARPDRRRLGRARVARRRRGPVARGGSSGLEARQRLGDGRGGGLRTTHGRPPGVNVFHPRSSTRRHRAGSGSLSAAPARQHNVSRPKKRLTNV